MDDTKDSRLEELKAALSTYEIKPKEEENKSWWEKLGDLTFSKDNELTSITSIDWATLQSAQIPAITTVQLGALTANAALGGYTVTTGGSGGGGGGGLGGYIYTSPNTVSGTSAVWNTPVTTITADDVIIKGRSIKESLDRIEEQLGILDCAEELESEWKELRELGKKYRAKKKYIEDKMKTFETLKK